MVAIRATRILRGPFSRMMDLGGVMPPSKTSSPIRTVDASKNCKVRAVAFDFDLITQSIQSAEEEKQTFSSISHETTPASATSAPGVMTDMVQDIANLLNVKLGGESNAAKNEIDDDLSALMGENAKKQKKESKQQTPSPFSTDIRSKYAEKLKKKGTGLAGMDHAKQEVQNSLSKGDAAGHLAARAAAVSQGASSETKWLALTGTGTLLTYISNRSMKIALLPIPFRKKPETRMKEFTKQLPQVTFDLLIEKGEEPTDILDSVLKEFDLDPIVTMVVSNRDDYLRAAKDKGMVACRIRPLNARRGNVSAHYNVESVAQVQDVVNEINGISFQATIAAGSR